MRALVISDIHGDMRAAETIKEILNKEIIDKVIILGDMYKRGFSSNYHVADILNEFAGKIIGIRGNCDSDNDIRVSNFDISDKVVIKIHDKLFFFTHGHLYNYNTLPIDVDYYVQGHTHVSLIKKVSDMTLLNPGSISYPRDGRKPTYMIIDDYISIYDCDHFLVDKIKI